MNLTRIGKIGRLIFAGLLIFVFSCQKEELNQEEQLETFDAKVQNQINKRKKPRRIRVCYNGRVFRVHRRAVRYFRRLGAAIDRDRDGYFDIENGCSEIDCNDRDPNINPGIPGSCDSEPGIADLLIGVWTSTDIDINPSVGAQSLIEYLISEVGLTPEEAATQNDLFIASLVPELTGSLTLNADNTYESDFIGGSDTGTWDLSADEMTLTLFEGPDTIVITINSISDTTWSATLSDDFLVDVDNDPGTPDILVTVVANVILTK